MNKIKSQILWIAILLFIVSACDKNRVFDNFVAIPDSGWEKDSFLTFQIPVSDTLVSHNLFLKVRNETSYSYSNLWLFIDIIQPDGVAVKDTFEITLADPIGKWLGDGLSNLKTRETVYRRNVYFPVSGEYQVKIEQGMRETSLAGIHDIGFRVEKMN